jgi:hypothetical protein
MAPMSIGAQVAGAGMAGRPAPGREGAARGGNGGVYLGARALSDGRERLPIGGIDRLKRLLASRPVAVDEVAETAGVAVEPGQDRVRRLRGRPPDHRLEDLSHARHTRKDTAPSPWRKLRPASSRGRGEG